MAFEPPTAPDLSGAEPFDGVDAVVLDFWKFAMSDLRTNNVRGYLAEFLVATAVGADGRRVEWNPWDVTAPDGTRIEVKSSAYLQSWAQARLSTPSFKVSSAYGWDEISGARSTEQGFNADVYVFCLHTAMSHDDYDALDVSKWQFFVVPRSAVEARAGAAMGLGSLERLGASPVKYSQLRSAIAGTTEASRTPTAESVPAARPSAGRPRMHKDPEFLARKKERLWEHHVAPINNLVERIRLERGDFVPYVDPDSGGVDAQVLFVLESPAAPAAKGSDMLSPDNNDGTAANMWEAYAASGLPRSAALHWNAVPWFVGDGQAERNVTNQQVTQGHKYLGQLLEIATNVQIIVAMGKPAQLSLHRIDADLAAQGIRLIDCIHPSPRNNSRAGPARVLATFEDVVTDLARLAHAPAAR